MSNDKQQPRKRIEIPTPKELDESVASGQSQQGTSQEQKGVRSRVRRFSMRMRGGVGQNKKVFKAPRPDAKPVEREAPPGEQGPGDVESSVREPTPERLIGDESTQVQQDTVPSEADPGTDPAFKDEVGEEEDKQTDSPRSRVRTVNFSPKLKQRKEEPELVPDKDTKRLLSREELAKELARHNAQNNDHDIGDFKPVSLEGDKIFAATCKKCGLDIQAIVAFDNFDVKGTPQVGGKAKGVRCKGVGGYSSGTS